MRRVFGGIAGCPHEADGIASDQRHPGDERLLVSVEVRVVIDDAPRWIGGVDGIASRTALTDAQYAAIVGGKHRCPAGRQNVDRAVTPAAIARLVERVLKLAHHDTGHRYQKLPTT